MEHGDGSQRQHYEPNRNNTMSCMSPKTEVSASPVQSQVIQRDIRQVPGEARADQTLNQIQPMDLVTSESSSPEPEGYVPRSKLSLAIKEENEPDAQAEQDQRPEPPLDALVNDQLDNCQYDPQNQTIATPSSPVHRVFDFERDETPPAEIVEATAEWYRTQNIPPNFDSISLQHVFQYYQNSVAVSSSKIEDGSLWPATQSQLGREQQQEQTAATDSACSAPTPIMNQCSLLSQQPYATSTEANANASDDTITHLPQLEASPFKLTNKESSVIINSDIQHQMETVLDKSKPGAQEFHLPEEGSIHSVTNENIFPYGHAPSGAYEHRATGMNTRGGKYRSGIEYEGTRARMELEEEWKMGSVHVHTGRERDEANWMECAHNVDQCHKSDQPCTIEVSKESRENIATHYVVGNGRKFTNLSCADSPVRQPVHDDTLRLHSRYSEWKCSSENNQNLCEGPNLVSDGYPQGANMTDKTIPAFPSRFDKDVPDGEVLVPTIQCEGDGWLQNVTGENIPRKEGDVTDKTSQTFAVETKSAGECNSDTSTQTSALGGNIETMEIQTVPLRKQQVCEYKYLQKSYYKVSDSLLIQNL